MRSGGWSLLALLLLAWNARAELVISEILLNPPGPNSPNQFIELRGTPNAVLPAGTYLLSIEGDTNGNPGVVQNLFDLSGRMVGANGFLVLLQKFHNYSPSPLASVLTNSDTGSGWGSGSSSSIGHRGENGQTELEDASCTFFLISTTNAPSIGDDIDADNDGIPDGPEYASWTILDSVGVLDNSGLGDIAYGAINFRRDSLPGRAAAASGVIVPLPFTPQYIGRSGNTTGSLATAWVASDNLGGASPVWSLGLNAGTTTNTVPPGLSGAALNHLGGPNFGAPAIPGVLLTETGGGTAVAEAGGTDTYSLALTVPPSGAVSIEITAGPQLQISTDGGTTFARSRTLNFSSTAARTVTVRALDDNVVDTAPHFSRILHVITSTLDPTSYPRSAIVPDVNVAIIENDTALLSEVKVNPPGAIDGPYEFIEIKGAADAWLTNVYLLAIDGNSSGNPGRATLVVDLTGRSLGSSGLLVVAGAGHPYNFPASVSEVLAPQLGAGSGALGNDSLSILLVASPARIEQGSDLDNGNNGILEGLPHGTILLDAVGWTDGDKNDLVYGGVDLTQATFTPDAAGRFPGNTTALSAAAWFCGDLAGSAGDSLEFDSGTVSENFPRGTVLTPGLLNNTAPVVSRLAPLSHVIGDPDNPAVTFSVRDAETSAASLVVAATSTDQSVVPDANLVITEETGGRWTLALNPVGVGYADIIVSASDGLMTGRTVMPYAASAMGRPGGHWHTGASDGSTAFAIDRDWMIVGDDENQTLRLFSRTKSGGPVVQFQMNPSLALLDLYSDGTPKEIDIEACTHAGNRLFWLGSHSHGFDGTIKTNRARLFATDLSGTGTNCTLTFVGAYQFLKVDLIAWDSNNGHGKGSNYYGLADSGAFGVDPKAPDGSGFNLEGLSMAPGNTNVGYIAFRAPLVPPASRTCALVVPVNNFATLASVGGEPGTAVFGVPIELNLGCRGIRSLEGDTNGYLIIAGPPGPADGIGSADFRLFTWTGYAIDAPEERAADLSGLNPEGIVDLPKGPWSSTNQFQLISDNGILDYYNDGIEAKHLAQRNFKKFRSDWVTLGSVVPARPILRRPLIADGILTLQWCCLAGTTYQVQYKSDLNQPTWIDLGEEVFATGTLASKSLLLGPDAQRFYRVVTVP